MRRDGSITCEAVRAELGRYLDGEDPAGGDSGLDRAKIETHLESCPDCARIQSEGTRLKEFVRGHATSISVPSGLAARVREHLEGEREPRGTSGAIETIASRERHRTAVRFAVAAAILILATLVFFVAPPGADPASHHALAESAAQAFLARLGAQPVDSELAASTELEAIATRLRDLGVEMSGVPTIPGCDLVGWSEETLAGQKAIRIDFRPRDGTPVTPIGEGPRTLASVFVLAASSMTAPDWVEKEMAANGHNCEGCVQFDTSGTILCVRREDALVAAVANAASRGFTDALEFRR